MTAVEQEGFIRVDFAGPGGTSMGLRMLGLDSVGVEYEASAVATARAAGFKRWFVDVTSAEVRSYPWKLWGYCASPECTTFSLAGKGEGRAALGHLAQAAHLVAAGSTPEAAVAAVRDEGLGKSATLSLEPLLVIRDHRPRWVALEQVPGVLPLWEVYAEILAGWGYSVDVGILNVEQYGVPQTRKRAILVASLDRVAKLPVPTHSKFHNRTPGRLDEGVQKWVSMAEALGWGVSELVGFPRRADGQGESITIGDIEYRSRDLRAAALPSATVTEKARSVVRFAGAGPGAQERVGQRPRELDEPAHTVTGSRSAYWVPGEAPHGPTLETAEENRRRVQLRNNTSANAAVRDESEPAPTMYFGARLNKMVWEPSDREPVPGEAPHGPDTALVSGNQANAAVRPIAHPAPTVAFGHAAADVQWIRAQVVSEVEGRVNNQSGTEFDLAWPLDRPAPVIAGRDLVTMPGANANRFNGSTKSRNDGVRVTAAEAGILQSMPADYPWTGTKTQQFQQVGNMVPALLQAAIVYALLTGPRITQ